MMEGRGRRQADTVEKAYLQVKEMTVRYEIRPEDRIKEAELAEKLSISRTPLREALNRLVSEGLVRFVPNKGFFCRGIDTKEVFDLYELRAAIECTAVRLGCQRASDEAIDKACRVWTDYADRGEEVDIDALTEADENFHLEISRLSNNAEIVKTLEAINARIRFFRKIDIENRERGGITRKEHNAIIDALRRRDPDMVVECVQDHVRMSAEHAIEVTKEGLARIFLGSG